MPTNYFKLFTLDTNTVTESTVNEAEVGLSDQVIKVTQSNVATTLGGTIDSTKLYLVSGSIDCTGVSIEVPTTGIFLAGWNMDLSALTCADNTYTMFTSPVGGSGSVFIRDMSLTASGTSSMLFDLEDVDGTNAFECLNVNFNGCTAIGELNGYRQGLESNTGRFGGSPALTLSGTWGGGYRCTTSIVRGLSAGFAGALFTEGTAFTMASRFLTDINCDLSASAAFCDFLDTVFLSPSLFQIHDAVFTRDGVYNADDANLVPNTSAAALTSSWKGNLGLPNTFVGGRIDITGELATSITVIDQFETLNATWTSSELQHVDSPAAGQLRHLGLQPREFKALASLSIEGPANDEVDIRFRKWDDSASGFIELPIMKRQVNAFVGGRDVAFFAISTHVTLDQNDYIYLQVANATTTGNVTAELDGFFMLEER